MLTTGGSWCGNDATLSGLRVDLEALWAAMISPLEAVARGELRVRGWRHPPRFLWLFARPAPDHALVPLP